MSEPYGKFYAKTFTGSMRGAGSHVIALMSYAIAHAKPPDGEVEINVDVAAFLIGDTKERIQEALDYLCAPDESSRTKDEDGRRLVRVGQFKYRLVTWAAHREGVDDEARRKYWRDKQAENRARKSQPAEEAKEPTLKFKKPSTTELVAEGLSMTEAEKFFHHYESNGWKVGKTPMKNWKSAVAGWKSRSGQFSNDGSQPVKKTFNSQADEDAELLRQATQ